MPRPIPSEGNPLLPLEREKLDSAWSVFEDVLKRPARLHRRPSCDRCGRALAGRPDLSTARPQVYCAPCYEALHHDVATGDPP